MLKDMVVTPHPDCEFLENEYLLEADANIQYGFRPFDGFDGLKHPLIEYFNKDSKPGFYNCPIVRETLIVWPSPATNLYAYVYSYPTDGSPKEIRLIKMPLENDRADLRQWLSSKEATFPTTPCCNNSLVVNFADNAAFKGHQLHPHDLALADLNWSNIVEVCEDGYFKGMWLPKKLSLKLRNVNLGMMIFSSQSYDSYLVWEDATGNPVGVEVTNIYNKYLRDLGKYKKLATSLSPLQGQDRMLFKQLISRNFLFSPAVLSL